MILQAGAGIIVNGLVPFSQMFQDAFGLEGVIAEDNAIAAAVQRCGWIILPATRACRPVRPTRCRRSARQCVTGDGRAAGSSGPCMAAMLLLTKLSPVTPHKVDPGLRGVSRQPDSEG